MKASRYLLPIMAAGLSFSALNTSLANTHRHHHHPITKKTDKASNQHHVILFVWDGLRPDSISKEVTPNLYRLTQEGVWFSDNHSSYPTFTMMNASSFATGDFAGKTGFYGNTLWHPSARGKDAANKTVDFEAPVFTEDYKVLKDLNRPDAKDPLVFVGTLFQAAHKAGLKTSTVGKSGAAFFQDYKEKSGMNGIIIDEKHVYPLALAQKLQQDNYPIPKLSPNNFKPGALTLAPDNGDPTAFGKVATMKQINSKSLGLSEKFIYPDNVTPDASATAESPYSKSNTYLMDTFLNKILPNEKPRLAVVWMRNPDTTEHNYGVGSASYITALKDQDKLLGKLLEKLKALNLTNNTDLIIASDHAHSNVSGPLTQFPTRAVLNGGPSGPDSNGYSVSGDIRPADLLTRAGFLAYDGNGCEYDPVLSGIKSDGRFVYPIREDKDGSICGESVKVNDSYGHREQKLGHLYTTPTYRIPSPLPHNAIIVAGNGGSTYLYIVDHNPSLVKKVVRFLQSREEFGAVFLDDRYGQVPGTLSMSLVHIKNAQGRNPDIIVGSSYIANAKIRGMKGIEFNSSGTDRGMHGSFSPIDVHNTLVAIGPDFKSAYQDNLPSGNVDVAPTIAHILHLQLPGTNGRPLLEALKQGKAESDYHLLKVAFEPAKPATGLQFQLATDPNGKDIDPSITSYTIHLQTKMLSIDGKTYTYFDYAKAKRGYSNK